MTECDEYPPEEPEKRLEAALRGAWAVGHKEKKEYSLGSKSEVEGETKAPSAVQGEALVVWPNRCGVNRTTRNVILDIPSNICSYSNP